MSRFSHPKIFERLAQEQRKIQHDVELLKQKRSRRATPCSTPLSTPRGAGAGESGDRDNKMDLYRVALLLREANKITQFLRKDTVRVDELFMYIARLSERSGSGVEFRTLDYENPGSNPGCGV